MIKCKMCGGPLNITGDQRFAECEYCGSVQTLPSLDSEKKNNLFNRANNLRLNKEFDKAAGVYESIVAEFPDEGEAYWGLCLCKYGIEYVDDPGTARKIPTCHRTCTMSILNDEDYKTACRKADATSQKIYHEEAKAIEQIQHRILDVASREKPYDIFICYKETDDNTHERTTDSAIAQDIYTELVKDGYKVFFSRITLRGKAGSEYEPYIYSALSSARVMLAIGTKPEYYDAVWVKNEWFRYLKMMGRDGQKALIPCYQNMDAYDIPTELQNLQALNMGDMMFYTSLKENINRIIPKNQEEPQVVERIVRVSDGEATNAEALCKRATQFLEQQNWEKATQYADRILDSVLEYADAYLLRLMSKLHYSRKEDFLNLSHDITSDFDYKKYLQYANKIHAEEIRAYATDAKYRAIYERAMQLVDDYDISYQDYDEALEILHTIPNWKDVQKQIAILKEKRMECIYQEACNYLKGNRPSNWKEAIDYFNKIPNYKDSSDLLKQAQQKGFDHSYNQAVSLKDKPIDTQLANGNQIKEEEYNSAIDIFKSLNGWKNSQQLIKACEDGIKDIHYKEASYELESKKFDFSNVEELKSIIQMFEQLGDYQDASKKAAEGKEKLKKVYRNRVKKIDKERRRIKRSPVVLILMIGFVIAGSLLFFSELNEERPVLINVLCTLLVFSSAFAWLPILGSSEEDKYFSSVNLASCFIGDIVCVIPLFIIFGILEAIKGPLGLVALLINILRVGIIVIGVIALIGCLVSIVNSFKHLSKLRAMREEIPNL